MVRFPMFVSKNGMSIHRVVILSLLYLIPTVQALLPIDDPDIWWHLRTGQWIIQQKTVPVMDPFSIYGADKTWIAYSWLFDILVYAVYATLGLLGLVLLTVLLSAIIALAIHCLVRRAGFPFFAEVLITAIGLMCLKPQLSLRPWLFTILFFTIELHLLFEAKESDNPRKLFLLPLLFAVWANLHVQFVYGLFALILFAAEPFIDHLLYNLAHGSRAFDRKRSGIQKQILIIGIVSLVATLLTPYHIVLYRPIFEYATQTRVFENINELHPMFFRSAHNWFVLGVAFAAAFVLGWRRTTGAFPYLLLVMGAALSFRARRDTWVITIVSLAIFSACRTTDGTAHAVKLTKRETVFVAALVIFSLFAVGYYRDISEQSLRRHVVKVFPAKAVAFVSEHAYDGPLYNMLDWGGYLIWALPRLRVAIDGRTNLHGAERIERSLRTWSGYPAWSSDPELRAAQLIIAPKNLPLTSFLQTDPGFRAVYQDEVAVVFLAKRNAAASSMNPN